MKHDKSWHYFDFIFWRFAFALGSYWKFCTFPDSDWYRIGLGFYWKLRDKPDNQADDDYALRQK